MSRQRSVGDVAVGDELDPVTRNASRAQLFLYSAATHNPHRIHYDRDYALTEGHADIIVHGPLQGAWLSQYVTDSFSCTPATDLCPDGSSIDGSAFHSWIGVGLRGAYTP